MAVSSIEVVNTKPKRRLGIRHMQAVLLFLAMVITFGIKINMSLAIVAMTDTNQENHFQWDTQIQSILLSSFFWGYFVLQIPGGKLADRYGGKLLVVLSVAINSALSLIIPIGASFGGWKLVCACRVIQGLTQGFVFPCVYNILDKWAPLYEKSRMCTFIYSGGTLGTGLQLILSGFIANSWGWQGIFYTNGVVGITWTVIYIILGANSPQLSTFISSKEKLYIQRSLGHIGDRKPLNTPWKHIWTSLPFISLIIAHCGESGGFWMLATEMPSYMSQALGVNVKQNGVISAVPYLAMYLVSFPLGIASDYIIKKKWLSVTASRKVANSIGHFGPALALISMSYVPAGNITLAVVVLVLAVGLNAGILSGFMLVHIDMAPNFAGVLMGITCCISNIVALLAPLVAGAILKDQTNVLDWYKVFYVAAAIYATGNLIFLIFGTSERQTWNDIEQENTVSKNVFKDAESAPTTNPSM